MSRQDQRFLLPVLFLVVLAPLGTAEIELVADMNIKGGGILEAAALAGWGYFSHNDGASGAELWRSDGTQTGTALFADLRPGGASSAPADFAVADGRLWFSADGGDGRELWVSDGTPAGTRQVVDLVADGGSDPGAIGPAAGGIIFYATTPAAGREPWFSDGTAAGTVQLADIYPGATSSVESTSVFDLRVWGQLGDRRVFSAKDDQEGIELWISDGTPAGTRLIEPSNSWSGFNEGRYFGTELVQVGDRCYFNGGGYLQSTDGDRIEQVGSLRNPRDLCHLDGALYAVINNKDLYRIADDGADRASIHTASSAILNLSAAAGRLWFRDSPPGGGGGELWVGDASGSTFVDDLFPGSSGSEPTDFVELDDTRVVFLARRSAGASPAEQFELWISDGSAANTQVVDAIDPAGLGINEVDSWPVATADGLVFWSVSYPGEQGVLAASDGSTGGTGILARPRFGPSSSRPSELVAVGERVFGACDPNAESNLSMNDGHLFVAEADAGGTVLQDFFPGEVHQVVGGDAGVIDDIVWYGASREGSRATWIADGDGLARQVATVSASHIRDLGDGRGAFVAEGSLWRVVGTESDPAATVEAVDGPQDPADLLVVGDHLFLTATGGGAGRELWRFDGSTAERVVDIAAGSADGLQNPDYLSTWHRFRSSQLVAWQEGLVFAANDGDGVELWYSDGSIGDAEQLTDLAATAIGEIVRLGDRLVFAAKAAGHGRELWATDGGAGGAWRIADIASGAADAAPRWLTVVDDRVFFTADDGTDRELWVTDAALTTAAMVVNLHDDAHPPMSLVAVGGQCLFTLDQDATGEELWQSDGSAAGTSMVADLWPGYRGSEPFAGDLINSVVVGDTIYFAAGQPAVGVELFSYSPETVVAPERQVWIDVDLEEPVEASADGLSAPVPTTFTTIPSRELLIEFQAVEGNG